MSEKDLSDKTESTPVAESESLAPPTRPTNERQETGLLDDVPFTPATETPPSRPKREVRFEDTEDAPPKPPRPLSPGVQNLATLIEAFPDIDPKVIKAVLTASGGQVEPAFNALLGMSDPSFEEEAPPPMPPRRTAEQRQLDADEAYARRLAQKYQTRDTRRPTQERQQAQPDDKEYSFFDDFTSNELPEIKKNISQGFQQTQSFVNSWITGVKKRFDGDGEEHDDIVSGQGTGGQRQNFGSSTADQLRGIRKNAEINRNRRSMDTERYDADAPALSENFGELEIHDNDEMPPRRPSRPLANPSLFKPMPPPPQSGPVDEVDAVLYDSGSRNSPMANRSGFSTSPGSAPGSTRSKKWQPLTSLAPVDVDGDDDNDPFSLGDSDDDVKEIKTTDINAEATARLKRAASMKEEAEADTGEGSSSSPSKTLKKAETTGAAGTRNKEADELLKG